jgi:transcriptional regulator with XRE-family HTH domain
VIDVKIALGRRIRALRKAEKLTLEELGTRVDLSASTLSKIENGILSVTYDTLVAISAALSGTVAQLFAHEPEQISSARRDITRAGEGDRYETDVYSYEMLCTEIARRKIIPIHATIKAHSITEFPHLISHVGEEFFYVLEGEVTLHSEHYQPTLLRRGDSTYFDSRMGHAIVSGSDQDARILWISTDLSSSNLPEPLRKQSPVVVEQV